MSFNKRNKKILQIINNYWEVFRRVLLEQVLVILDSLTVILEIKIY